MRQQNKHILIKTCLLLASCLIASGQRPITNPPDWWYNFPSSPLVFQPSNPDASYMDLKNLSQDMIVAFRPGCITKTDNGMALSLKLKSRDLTLKPSQVWFQSAFSYRDDLDQCPASARRLAIVEVHFADGGVWTR